MHNTDNPNNLNADERKDESLLSKTQLDEINALRPDFFIDKTYNIATEENISESVVKFKCPPETKIIIYATLNEKQNLLVHFNPFFIDSLQTRVTFKITEEEDDDEQACCIVYTPVWFENHYAQSILAKVKYQNPFIKVILLAQSNFLSDQKLKIGFENYDNILFTLNESDIRDFFTKNLIEYYQLFSLKSAYNELVNHFNEKTEQFKQLRQRLSKAVILISNKNTQLNQQKKDIEEQRSDLERALKSSTKHYVRLQKSLILNQEQQKKLEVAVKEMVYLNEQLKIHNEEVLAQRDEIEKQQIEIQNQRDFLLKQYNQILEQQDEITDNLNYSQRIQRAILPQEEFLSLILPIHFLINLPRNIVSGDFYWITQNRSKTIVAVGDATGHGVSGALMSMLGIAFLNEIINKDNIVNSNEILDRLRLQVIKSLHQSGSIHDSKDGFDMSLCVIDIEKNTLQFSGANNPVYILRNNHLIELKADKMPIGYHETNNKPYNAIDIDLHQNDMIYMFSDGFADQFGGAKGTKFKLRYFKEMFVRISHLEIQEQKSAILDTYQKWKGKHEQVDDILILGFRFP